GRLWSDLSSDNAANIYRSVWTLAAGPGDAVPFLKEKFPALAASAPAIDSKQLQLWIRELDHDKFQVRERATKELKNHLALAVPLLKKEIKQPRISAEVRYRVEQLLKFAEPQTVSPEQARLARAVHVLEYMETLEARLGRG